MKPRYQSKGTEYAKNFGSCVTGQTFLVGLGN